jgi:pre-rRNA-processing protein TSR2
MSLDHQLVPPPSSILFARGVIARLAIWPALRIAVDQGWGGPEAAEKRRWLASVVVDAFEEQVPSPDVYYIEETLLQVMADEFETVLEDGSAEDVAKDMVQLWADVLAGNTDTVARFEERASNVKGKIQVQEVVESDDGSDGDEDEDEEDAEENWEDEAPQLLAPQPASFNEPVVDADGFTLVQGRGKGRR